MLDRFHGISKFYIAKGKTDLRMGIDGLVHKITAEFKLDPYDNTAFLFCGGRSNRLKVVIWEGDGFTLMYKRFEKGRMQWPRTTKEAKLITSKQLEDLLSGLQIEPPNPIVKIPKVAILEDDIASLLL
jgi:transposase